MTKFVEVHVETNSRAVQWGSEAVGEYFMTFKVKDTSGDASSLSGDANEYWGIDWTIPTLLGGIEEFGQLILYKGETLMLK